MLVNQMFNEFSSLHKHPIELRGHVDRDMSSKNWMIRMLDWNTFYRRNIHRFIEHYFGIKLYLYQIIWIYFMSICNYFITIASRASAKSWLIAVYSCAIAVLYPHSEIVIVSDFQKTAGVILGKIKDLMSEHKNLASEVDRFVNSESEKFCRFKNSSTIKVVACKDSARGTRATVTIAEEYPIMNKDLFDQVVRPFSYSRISPYTKLDEWAALPQENSKMIFISSASDKGKWWYVEAAETIKATVSGKSAGFIAFDYITSVYHKIKNMNEIEDAKKRISDIAFQEEYCNIPWGEGSDAYFRLFMFENNSNIKVAFYPQRNDRYNFKKNPYNIKKQDGEIRVISADIATRPGDGNDNTVICCIRCLPTATNGYRREYCYMESHNGENTVVQAIRLKQIFNDFEADYIVIDAAGNGIGIYDDLGEITKDDERGCEYEAYTVMYSDDRDKKQYEDFLNRTRSKNANPVIYPVIATAKLNNDIAVSFRDKLQKHMINFLVNEREAEEYLLKTNVEYLKTNNDISERAWLLHPYVQYANMINESVSLSMSLNNGLIKLTEPSGGRKDRYTSVSYGNYFITTVLDPTIRKERTNDASGIINCAFY